MRVTSCGYPSRSSTFGPLSLGDVEGHWIPPVERNRIRSLAHTVGNVRARELGAGRNTFRTPVLQVSLVALSLCGDNQSEGVL
jgi:hypothetical protein